MNDPRIKSYREAAEAMLEGRFNVQVPVGHPDDVAELGIALMKLGGMLEVKFQEIQKILNVTAQINSGVFLDEICDYIYDSFRPIIPYDRIGVSLLDDEKKNLIARWARSEASAIRIKKGYSAALKGSSLESIIQSGQPRIINNLVDYLEEHPSSVSTQLIVEEGMKSSLTCPLIAMGRPIGFIFFTSMKADTYHNVHSGLFLQIAGQLSTIIEKSRMYQQMVDLNLLKSKFLGMAAHDLRNPLTVMKGYASIMLDGALGDLSERQEEVTNTILNNCDKMLSIIDTLLDVSAIEMGRLDLDIESTKLNDFLERCVHSNSIIASSKKIDISLELPAGLPLIPMDPHRMEQVIDNLITNAVKFSYPGTLITVSAQEMVDGVEISVTDEGQGIPEDELPKIFTEFGTTSVQPTAGEKSTGLGLAIVKKIVEAHGGKIRVESQVGKGTTFTITLHFAAIDDDPDLD